jgi:hypothetical protein
LLKETYESLTGELGALVGVEYLGPTPLECLMESLDAEVGVKCVRQPPGEHIPAVHVYNGYQVEEFLGPWGCVR